MKTPFTSQFVALLTFATLTSCGLDEDISKKSGNQKDENYQRGYDWAKTHAITDEEGCVRFIHLATISPELQGCIDYYREYKKKAREFSGEDHEGDEIEAAPSAPIDDVQNEDECENINEFCTN